MRKSFLVLFLVWATFTSAQEEGDSGRSELLDKWSGQGEVTFEFRQFRDDDDTHTMDKGIALFSRVETTYEDPNFKHVFRGYGRVDRKDESRSIVAFEDAYFSAISESTQLYAGYKLFNWSATEAFHPADVINSRNYDSNLENLEKKGELTLQVKLNVGEASSFNLLFFPRFERPEFPGNRSRLFLSSQRFVIDRPQIAVGKDAKNSYWTPQYGAMLNTSLFGADLNLHALYHVDRNFPIVGTHNFTQTAGLYAPVDGFLTPYYFRVLQTGGTFQLPVGAFIFKVEGAYRKFEDDLDVVVFDHYTTVFGTSVPVFVKKKPEDHSEVAAGVEYVIGWDESGSETNLFLEVTSIFNPPKRRRQEMSVFQRDAMIGLRHAFNDKMGSELFFSMIQDLERSKENLYNANFTQRLSDNWKYKIGARFYVAPRKDGLGLESLHEDHHVFLNLTRYF